MAATSADHNHPFDNPMTSATEEELHAPEQRSPAALNERPARGTNAHWVDSLRRSDVTRLWAELHRIVCSHPLVR
ncbi:MAG TPA: hypothetical protein VER76_05490, partial [Pyrinomonadaceae bacterium]|nr:hypothetical protein [Pyrinomonadaceae bacterium]